MNILSIQTLTKYFGDNRVIDNLTLSIEQGEIFGLIGPNGAGKTTTINCIADLLDYDEGEIKIFDKFLKKEAVYIKKKIGILFENNDDLFIHLKGEEHLQFIGEIYGLKKAEIRKRMDELFDYFELNDSKYKLIEEYSKGMKKKLAMASILLHDPEFIILDEPFDGLDTLTVIKVKKLIKSLKEKGFIEKIDEYSQVADQPIKMTGKGISKIRDLEEKYPLQGIKKNIKDIITDFENYASKDMELRATLIYVYISNPSLTYENLMTEFRKIKGKKFHDDEIESAYVELIQKGYIYEDR